MCRFEAITKVGGTPRSSEGHKKTEEAQAASNHAFQGKLKLGHSCDLGEGVSKSTVRERMGRSEVQGQRVLKKYFGAYSLS